SRWPTQDAVIRATRVRSISFARPSRSRSVTGGADRSIERCGTSGGLPMILIGQYDSPFVRRVGIALTLYGLPFEHRPWSTFGDADKVRPYNPLVRVPTLVLDDGEVLIESHSILDHIDSLVPADRRLFPAA